MPELPEVETIVQKLRAVLPGKKIRKVIQLHKKTFVGDQAKVEGSDIIDVTRRAKIIRFHLPGGLNLIAHLKMTGQFIYQDEQQRLGGGHPTADWVNDLPSKHTRVVIELEPKATLFFNDQRLFGWIKVVTDEGLVKVYENLGPDVIDDRVTVEYLAPLFKNKTIPIKQAIMDNTIMCGLGNIYACDALNLAQIHPQRPTKSLNKEELERLVAASKETLRKGIELGGTTFDGKYVDTDGFAGKYQSVVRTYGRKGKPCLHCGSAIEKSQLGGRGTYYCPSCQI